eukprot:m.104801 g.104801  ORF g.104801 m.104801 type:complete len:648 (+) comp15261_c0_seq6:282-2225(+)
MPWTVVTRISTSSTTKSTSTCSLFVMVALKSRLGWKHAHCVCFQPNSCFKSKHPFSVSVSVSVPSIQVLSVKDGTEQTIAALPREPVLSMRYSLDDSILAIRRSKRSLALHNREVGASAYTLNVKNKIAELRSFFWVANDEILLVTSLSVELYRVNARRRTTKQLKSYNVSVSWYQYSPSTKVLLTASSLQPNIINSFQLTRSTIVKIPRVDVVLPHLGGQSKALKEQDVCMIRVYGRLYMAVTKNNPKGYAGPAAEIHLYLVTKEGVLPAHSLELEVNGRFLLNTIDNLVLVHHQTTKCTYAFDVEAQLTRRRSMTPSGADFFRHDIVFKAGLTIANEGEEEEIEGTYAASWLAFPTNVIIDPRAGSLWQIKLDPQRIIGYTADTAHLIELLLRRKGGQEAILDALRAECEKRTAESLACMAIVFDSLHRVEQQVKSKSVDTRRFNYQTIDQKLMYHEIFQPLSDATSDEPNSGFLMKLAVEYIRSLTACGVAVQHFIYELVINTLVSQQKEYQLHQFLQYHVLDDSKPVACLLLSLQSTYPPAFQLALDMFKRLGQSQDEIFDVLLSTGQVLPALRYMRSMDPEVAATIPARRFLEAARAASDDMLFYNVYMFYINRNIAARGSPDFLPMDQCGEFVKHFDVTFS